MESLHCNGISRKEKEVSCRIYIIILNELCNVIFTQIYTGVFLCVLG